MKKQVDGVEMCPNHVEVIPKYYSTISRKALVMIVCLLILSLQSIDAYQQFTIVREKNSPAAANYQTNHDAIIITSDEEFVLQGWPGNGTITNPYLIKDLIISTNDRCIEISNTSRYFEIENCFLSSSDGQNHGTGIHLMNVTYGSVKMCILSDLGIGIRCQYSTNNSFSNNTIETSWDGIVVESCNNMSIIGNTITNCGGEDVNLYNSRLCSVIDNSFDEITFALSVNCTVIDNYFHGEGMKIFGDDLTHWLHEVKDNYIAEKFLGYFRNVNDSDVDGTLYAQMILVRCANIVVSGGVFQHLSTGIQIISSVNCTLSDFTCSENVINGINIKNSSNCTVKSGFIDNSIVGILLSASESIGIEGNQVRNNIFSGIRVNGSNSCYLAENSISNNSRGLSLDLSTNCRISMNEINNNEIGINLASSNACLVIDNRVYANGIGIMLNSKTSCNSIYWNSFIGNTDENAIDDGQDNIWDDGIERGNIWSDYEGTGVYEIPGQSQSVDRYPMTIPVPIPYTTTLALSVIVIGVILLSLRKRSGEGR